ncbi:hypothetical protein JCM6882_009367 [Rhodosporidiobolus microsporus]
MADQSFLTIGRHCREPSCNQLDFLPFKCPCCALDFCGEHWRPPQGHKCAKWDPVKADNRIPSCPLCSQPISFPPSTDPNIPMDAHLSSSCPALHPHLASAPRFKPANECAEKKCKTKMIQPIQCDKCRAKFCPKHRFERDHACPGAQTVAAAGGGGAGVRKTLGGVLGKGKAVGGIGRETLAGLAALRRAQQAASSSLSGSSGGKASSSSSSAKPSTTSTAQTSKSSLVGSFAPPKPAPNPSAASLGSSTNPIVLSSSDDGDDSDVQIVSGGGGGGGGKKPLTGAKKLAVQAGAGGKVSKRALQEQESARRALDARAKKGLLTEDEKVRYATMQAMSAKSGGGQKKDGDGCCIV